MSYHVIWENHNVTITFSGEANYAEIDRVNTQLVSNPSFSLMDYQLWDFRKVRSLVLSERDLHIIAALDKSSVIWNEDIRVAIVVQDESVKQVFEQYLILMNESNWDCRIFKTFDEAKKWCVSPKQKDSSPKDRLSS